jgi:hypothetical protein
VAAHGLGNVEIVAGNVNDLAPSALGWPFDLAFTRLFLLYQPEPGHTLRRSRRCCAPAPGSVAMCPRRAGVR